MQLFKILIISAVFLPSCARSFESCRETGFSEEAVCDVTFSRLIINAKEYENNTIEVRGYYAVHNISGSDKKLLFISKEAELTADYGAAIEIGEISENAPKERVEIYKDALDKADRLLIIIGHFNAGPRRLPNGRSVLGVITPVVGVNPVVPPPRKND